MLVCFNEMFLLFKMPIYSIYLCSHHYLLICAFRALLFGSWAESDQRGYLAQFIAFAGLVPLNVVDFWIQLQAGSDFSSVLLYANLLVSRVHCLKRGLGRLNFSRPIFCCCFFPPASKCTQRSFFYISIYFFGSVQLISLCVSLKAHWLVAF